MNKCPGVFRETILTCATPSCVTFLHNTTGITGFSHKDNQLTGNTWQLLYSGQFGTDSVLRDDCQTAVLLQRQAEKSTSWMQHRNEQSQTFFSFSSPQDWLKIFPLKPSSTSGFRLSRPSPQHQIHEYINSRAEQRSVGIQRFCGCEVRISCRHEQRLFFFKFIYIYFIYWAEWQIQPDARR